MDHWPPCCGVTRYGAVAYHDHSMPRATRALHFVGTLKWVNQVISTLKLIAISNTRCASFAARNTCMWGLSQH